MEDAEDAWLFEDDVQDESLQRTPQPPTQMFGLRRQKHPRSIAANEQIQQHNANHQCGGQAYQNASARTNSTPNDGAEPAWKSFIAGGIAGCASKTATAPLSRLAILYQVQGTGVVHGWSASEPVSLLSAARKVVQQEGILAFWKGNGAMLLHRLPYSAINFAVFDAADSALRDSVQNDSGRKLLAGGIGGAVGCTACYPLDLARTRLAASTNSTAGAPLAATQRVRHPQAHTLTATASSSGGATMAAGAPSSSLRATAAQAYKHARDAAMSPHERKPTIVTTLKDAFRSGGIRGLFYGWPPTVLQVAPSLAVNFTVYSTCKRRLFSDSSKHSASLLSGSIAGISSAVAVFPVDLVRRRMQLSGQPFVHTLRGVLKEGGARALYRGIVPECCKVAPGMGLAFLTYESLKAHL